MRLRSKRNDRIKVVKLIICFIQWVKRIVRSRLTSMNSNKVINRSRNWLMRRRVFLIAFIRLLRPSRNCNKPSTQVISTTRTYCSMLNIMTSQDISSNLELISFSLKRQRNPRLAILNPKWKSKTNSRAKDLNSRRTLMKRRILWKSFIVLMTQLSLISLFQHPNLT